MNKKLEIYRFRSLELSVRHGLKDPNLEYFEVFRALAKDSARRSTGNLHENNNVSSTDGSVGLVGSTFDLFDRKYDELILFIA